MTANVSTSTDVWVPSPDLRLSSLRHPALCTAHPKFKVLPEDLQYLLNQLERQSNRWSHMPYFKDSLSSRRIAVLNGYHRAHRLVKCMMESSKYSPTGRLQRCELNWFCPFCAYLKGQDLLKKYAPAWELDRWYELVFSLRGGVCLTWPGHDPMWQVWDAMREFIRRLEEVCWGFGGFVAWEELAVNSFWPVTVVTPHINVAFYSESAPDSLAFARMLRATWRNSCEEAVPDFRFQAMKSEAHFYEVLDYVKPIDLVTPYNTGYRAARAKGQVEQFHQGVREFFEGYAAESSEERVRTIKGRPRHLYVERMHYFYGGRCHGSAGAPLGVPKGIRRSFEHQETIRARVEEAKLKEEELGDHDGCG